MILTRDRRFANRYREFQRKSGMSRDQMSILFKRSKHTLDSWGLARRKPSRREAERLYRIMDETLKMIEENK